MHESNRAERGFAGITKVCKPGGSVTNRHRVGSGQLHEEIVRMLRVNTRPALVGFSGLKQEWRTSRRKSKRLQAKHTAQLECARTHLPKRHWHKPVCGLKLGYSTWSTLGIDAHDSVDVKH